MQKVVNAVHHAEVGAHAHAIASRTQQTMQRQSANAGREFHQAVSKSALANGFPCRLPTALQSSPLEMSRPRLPEQATVGDGKYPPAHSGL